MGLGFGLRPRGRAMVGVRLGVRVRVGVGVRVSVRVRGVHRMGKAKAADHGSDHLEHLQGQG